MECCNSLISVVANQTHLPPDSETSAVLIYGRGQNRNPDMGQQVSTQSRTVSGIRGCDKLKSDGIKFKTWTLINQLQLISRDKDKFEMNERNGWKS